MEDFNISHSMQKEKIDLIKFLTNVFVNIAPPFIVGIMAKIASDITGGKRRGVIQWMAIFFLCLSATLLSNWVCESCGITGTKKLIVNTFSTLMSEQLFKIIFANGIPFLTSLIKANFKFTIDAMDSSKSNPPNVVVDEIDKIS